MEADLRARRVDAVRAWTSFVEHGDGAEQLVRPEIWSSWSRSEQTIGPEVPHAPLDDETETAAYWRDSPLQTAVERVEEDLRRTAEDGDLVVAVTDPQTRILWTYGGRTMRRKAESVNFVPGGRWDDRSAGTNALDLANRHDRAAMVFSAEHYASMVHNWVCWAAPVHDPVTGVQLGVLDLSTTWERTHPIGLATAQVMARLIEQASQHSQLWVVSHASRLVAALNEHPECHGVELTKELGETQIVGQGLLSTPNWHWSEHH